MISCKWDWNRVDQRLLSIDNVTLWAQNRKMSSDTCVQQCFKCSLERIFKCVLVFYPNICPWCPNICPRCPNVHMSKCPWGPNVHNVQMSMTQLSHVVTLVTCGHTCHMCHIWSHSSTMVTLSHKVTGGHIRSQETNISTDDQKVHLLSDYNNEHDQHIDLHGRR